MSEDITKLLKEATKDLLTEETLKAITEAVEARAEAKAQLAVEAALVQQDDEYAGKLQKVLEAIDADHTEKLDKVVSRIDEVHAAKFKQALDHIDDVHSQKLQKIVKLYEQSLKEDAKGFKQSLVEQLSNYIDLYIDKAIPAETIQEATKNTRDRRVVDEVKRLVGLSSEFVNENFKEALLDGKSQIDEAQKQIKALEKQNKLILERAENLEKTLFLEKKIVNFPPAKKEYMQRVLSEKTLTAIKENFNYVAEMYEKKESDDMVSLRETVTPKTKGVDVVAPAEVINETKSFNSNGDDGDAYVASQYVTEFTKAKY
jgi:hypothetical protein